MKTFFIHGKITPYAFHMKATFLKKPPSGYYHICEQIAESKHQAIRLTVENSNLQPPKGKQIRFDSPNGTAQTSFIKE
jgi:hypothetical protein